MHGLSLFLVLLNALALIGVLATATRDPALIFACAGLVTMSWDRVSVVVGPMTLKVTYVAFALAFAFELAQSNGRSAGDARPETDRVPWWKAAIARGALVCLVIMVISAVGGGHLSDGARQLFVISVGAAIPGWVTYRLGRSPTRRHIMIRWTFIGAALTAVIALYQFAAVRFGLPTILPYEGIAQGLGRTSGLSYEPAFLAMYLLSLTPLIIARTMTSEDHASRRSRSSFLLLIMFGILLANSRAGYLVLVPAVLIPIFKGRPKQRGTAIRSLVLVLMAVGVLSLATGFDPYRFTRDRLASIGDRNEVASNQPRLRAYRTETNIIRDHPWLGIGPGSLSYKLPDYGLPLSEYQLVPGPPIPGWRVVANNIWLQMLLDGGLVALASMIWLLCGLVGLARRSPDPDARWLATGCLLVILVGGMLTSIFWDVKLWALIGLCAGAAGGRIFPLAPTAGGGPDQRVATTR